MIIHNSTAKNNGWISTTESLPKVGEKVQTACITIMDWNLERVVWESTGQLRDSGIWRIIASESATQRNVFDYKITHWKPL